MRTIRWVTLALLIVTAAAATILVPLVVEVVRTCCSGQFQPTLGAFLIVWVLLLPLAGWQWSIWRGSGLRERL